MNVSRPEDARCIRPPGVFAGYGEVVSVKGGKALTIRKVLYKRFLPEESRPGQKPSALSILRGICCQSVKQDEKVLKLEFLARVHQVLSARI